MAWKCGMMLHLHMKRHASIFAILGIVPFLIGCVQTLHFKITDAATGKPLEAAALSVCQYRTETKHYVGEVDITGLPRSDSDGMIVVPGVHKYWWLSQFTVTHPGYEI